MRFRHSHKRVRELETRLAELEQLIGELAPLACNELLLTANLANRFMHESFDWRQRAERAESEIDFLAYSMVSDAFPEH